MARWEPLTEQERFWAKVDIRGPDECWPWTAAVFAATGYGQARVPGGSSETAHRRAYALTNGPVPEGLDVCHSCDYRLCCNPRHLFPGTRQDNMSDMVTKGRAASGERHSQARLTEAKVRLIRAALAAGRSQRAIGAAFGVGHATVGRIATGKGWRSVA